MSMSGIAENIRVGMDSRNPQTRDFAASIAKDAPGSYNVGQICLIWSRLSDDFRYVSDPAGKEDFVSPASRTIAAGLAGDCDDLAVLTAALIRAIGGEPRVIVAASLPYGHAYAEVYIGQAEYVQRVVLPIMKIRYPLLGNIHCHLDFAGGHWMNLDALGGRLSPGAVLFGPAIEWAVYPSGAYDALWE